MARVRGWMESWPLFVLSVFWLSLLACLHLWPSSWWLDVGSVHIADSSEGESPPMLVVRNINRPFSGDWQVTVRRWGSGWVVWCNASGSSLYHHDAHLPTALTLRWWTDGQCHPLPAGKYTVSTSWTVRGLDLIPDKQIRVESNIFEVRP